MADAGFFRGTSSDQDGRFSDKEKKLLKQMKFEDSLEKKVNMEKINLDIIKPWITMRINEILGMEDDVVIEYINSQLEIKDINPKIMQINITGFLNARYARQFMGELWNLLVEADQTDDGIPPSLVERKLNEMKKDDKNAAAPAIKALAQNDWANRYQNLSLGRFSGTTKEKEVRDDRIMVPRNAKSPDRKRSPGRERRSPPRRRFDRDRRDDRDRDRGARDRGNDRERERRDRQTDKEREIESKRREEERLKRRAAERERDRKREDERDRRRSDRRRRSRSRSRSRSPARRRFTEEGADRKKDRKRKESSSSDSEEESKRKRDKRKEESSESEDDRKEKDRTQEKEKDKDRKKKHKKEKKKKDRKRSPSTSSASDSE